MNDALQRWFKDRPTGAPVLAPARSDGGYWDFSDTALSIVNLETVREIARTAGRTIDPLRFRANIYIDGLPAWREFGLVGRSVVAGSTRLDVLRGIARCNATSIDPTSSEVDMNMPVHLRQTYGHIFCGVYAQVEGAGSLHAGDAVTPAEPYAASPYDRRASTSRPPHEWPRFLKVEDRGDGFALLSTLPPWHLVAPAPQVVLHHHSLDGGAPLRKIPLEPQSTSDAYRVDRANLPGWAAGNEILVSGPFPDREIAAR